MTVILRQLNPYNPAGAVWFFSLAVLVLLPALFFSKMMPSWAPPAALVGLAFLYLLRSAAIGHLIGHTPVDWLLLLLLLMLAVGLWTTPDLSVSLPRTYALIANLALFWVIAAQHDKPWLRNSGWLLLLIGLTLAPLILLFTNFTTAKFLFINRNIYDLLPSGLNTFSNHQGLDPNHSGGLVALLLMPAMVLVWMGQSWQQRDVAKLVVVILSVLLVLTQSRGALFGATIALLVITLLHSRRWSLFWLIALILTVIGIYLIGSTTVQETIFRQGDALSDPSLLSRQELWRLAIYLMQDFPLTGVGLGVIESAILPDPDIKNVHNLYLQTGVEMGIPSLIGHLSLYLITFFLLLRQALLDRNAAPYRILALGLLGSLITFLTHGFIEVITSTPPIAVVVWGLLGLMVAVATSSSNQTDLASPLSSRIK